MGRIFDIKRFAIHDGPGIRSTVFFTGCPLRCAWCHNPEAFAAVELDGSRVREVAVGELIGELERDIGYYDRSGGGVTLSGGEPLTQPEFVEAVLRKCRARDLRTAVDTSGCVESSLVEMAGRLSNLVLYDLKTIDNEVHVEWTGAGNTVILENLAVLDALEVEVWIRIPLVPGINDGAEDLDAMIEFLRDTRFRRVSLLPYHAIAGAKYRRLRLENRMTGVEPPDAGEVGLACARFSAAGFDIRAGS